jgi:cytochrome c oxidase assembly protein subunit 15
MEWAPPGALPPTSDAEWARLFDLYQKIPQYALLNEGFGLDGFKQIFWLEWTHRLWGRLIAVVFLLPMLLLWATARIERRVLPRLGLLFVLGGLQGAVGWFMVASLLPDTTAVRLIAWSSIWCWPRRYMPRLSDRAVGTPIRSAKGCRCRGCCAVWQSLPW